jgi:GT2 family glycosyltransferase
VTITPAPTPPSAQPVLSVIIINYNGAPWLERCLDSLRRQTIYPQIEIIVADNASEDQSGLLAAKIMRGWPNGKVIQHATNLGYSEGNNRATQDARGRYLFFLNNDTWLETDCLERLLNTTIDLGATAAAPLVMDYVDDTVQSTGVGGFDIFGFTSNQSDRSASHEIFMAGGCSLLIEAEVFRRLGGFDAEFFMYADEFDLCWRVWAIGGRVILEPAARVHHRGSPAVNPRGNDQLVENRTSDTKRFYANRNGLLVLLKNCQHVLLALVLLQLLVLAAEASFMGLVSHRWRHVRRAYGGALLDCWRLRGHILAERRRLRSMRRHGDWWMLRFLRWRLNRWDEFLRWRRFGIPKVDAR